MSLNPFDPVAAAKLRTREMAEAIKATGRDTAYTVECDVTNDGLALQAALRSLLPIEARTGIYAPGDPDPNRDPDFLQIAQRNWKAVYDGGTTATEPQKESAYTTIETVADNLRNQGYTGLARILDQFRAEQGYGPRPATGAVSSGPLKDPNL